VPYSDHQIPMQGRKCHAKFVEAAERTAGQFRRYERAAERPAIVTEGEENPTLNWLAKGGSQEWAAQFAEVEAYNSDFQVCPCIIHCMSLLVILQNIFSLGGCWCYRQGTRE